jgi:hypothetical protein
MCAQVYPKEKRRAVTQCDDKLTVLLEQELIIGTHSKLRVHKFRLFHQFVVIPALLNLSVVLALFQSKWNYEIPEREFGWERGREQYRKGITSEFKGIQKEKDGIDEAKAP